MTGRETLPNLCGLALVLPGVYIVACNSIAGMIFLLGLTVLA